MPHNSRPEAITRHDKVASTRRPIGPRQAWLAALVLSIAGAAPVVAAEWQPIEKIETYAISGSTGAELYTSIGEHGPKLGMVRTIAHTSFKLTWQRDYQTRGNDCVLASAKPKLIITTVLPKPSGALPQAVRGSWQTFIDGVAAHERVHGQYIAEMVREIEKATIGLAVADDPKCQKIRQQMQPLLGAISQAERQRQRDFDRVEFGNGGNVQQLILRLVNGP